MEPHLPSEVSSINQQTDTGLVTSVIFMNIILFFHPGKNSDPTELRLVLIGGRHKGGPSGKSSVGNIILGRDVFNTNRITYKSVMRQEEVSGR